MCVSVYIHACFHDFLHLKYQYITVSNANVHTHDVIDIWCMCTVDVHGDLLCACRLPCRVAARVSMW